MQVVLVAIIIWLIWRTNSTPTVPRFSWQQAGNWGPCAGNASLLPWVHPQVCISLGCVLTLKGKAVDFSNCPLQPAGYCGVVEQPCRQMESLLSGGALGQLHSVQQKPAPEVSFILTLHNNQDLALKCIWELFATSQEAAGVEFIVIDDASTTSIEGVRDVLELMSYMFDVQYSWTRSDEALGYGRANDLGARKAQGTFLAFINSDAFVQKGWLATLLHTIKASHDIGIVGPLFIGRNGLVQEAGGLVFRDASAANFWRGRPPAPEMMHLRRTDYISGACLVMRRQLYMAIGGLDDRFGQGYYEDTDLAMSVRAHGLHVAVQPLAVVYHQEGNTLGTDESPLKQQLMAANKKLFYDKWRHVLQHHPAPGSDHSTACLRHYKGSVSIMNASEPRAVAKAFDLAKHGYMVTLTSAAVPSLSVTRHLQAAGVAVVQPSFMSTSMQSAA